MTQSNSMLADLALLAQEKSSQKRVELLRRITDAYVGQSAEHSAAERYLLDEIVEKLIDKIGAGDRATVSTILSHLPSMPEKVERALAFDLDVEVARPILRDFRGISERTLVEAAATGSQNHLQAIASRPVVPPPVTDVVVARGEQETVRILAANKGAQFSPQGMTLLVDKAQHDIDLQALIIDRSDVTAEAIGRLLPVVSQELAARLRTKIDSVDELRLSKHLAEWMEERRVNVTRMDESIEAIRAGTLRLDDVATDLVANKRLLDLATLIASLVSLDRYYAFNVLTRGPSQSVLLLMRSLDLPWTVVDGFLQLRRAKIPALDAGPPVRPEEYDDLDAATAQRVIRFMKVRRSAMAGAGDEACA